MRDDLSITMTAHAINYDAFERDLAAEAQSPADRERWIFDELPYTWEVRYKQMTNRPTLLLRIEYQGFLYYYDHFVHYEQKGAVPLSDEIEDRVIGVVGKSVPAPSNRKASSWRAGLIGGTEKRWGRQFDKGHFIAHYLGGGTQLNLFAQRRDLNRGWSSAGKLYREMEDYCFEHPGTLCFHRPIYLDDNARPAALDFGLLRDDGRIWVARFDNQEVVAEGQPFVCKIPKGKELNAWVTLRRSEEQQREKPDA